MAITCQQFEHFINAPEAEFARHRDAVEEHMASCAVHGMTPEDFEAFSEDLRPYRQGDAARGILSDEERVARIRHRLARR